MKRGLLGKYFKGHCCHFQGQFKATWNESAQNILGKAKCLQTGVRHFHLFMYKWGLAPSPNCKRGITEQTADHVIFSCLIHPAQEEHMVCIFFDDVTLCWLNTTTPSI